jgi:hypothetical protein
MVLGAGLNRARPSAIDPPSMLTWTSAPLTSDDQDPSTPAIMNFRHASVGTSSLNTIRSSSRLLLPVVSA